MKRSLLVLLLACAVLIQAKTQVVSAGMGAEFKQLSSLGTRQSGFEGVQTYKSDNVKGSQFFTDTWKNGSVVTVTNDSISNRYVFLFDKVRQELFIKPKDSTIILLGDKNQIRSFTIDTDRPHFFAQATKYDITRKGKFIEVLHNAPSGLSLLKFTQTTFIKADMKDIEKVKNGDLSDEFADNTSYYFFYQNTLSPKLSFNENAITKRLEPYKNKVAGFFREHREEIIDESLLIKLAVFINQ